MNSTNLIIIVFGLIFLAWIMNQKNEGFSFFDKIEQMIDIMQDDLPRNNYYPNANINYDMAKEMEPVFSQSSHQKQMAPEIFKHNTLRGIEPVDINYDNQDKIEFPLTNQGNEHFPTNTARFSEDINKIDWQLEKHPNQSISELTHQMIQPISLKDAFDNTIKDYKKLNPQISNNMDKKQNDDIKAIDQNGFSYLEGHQPTIPNQNEILSLDPNNSTFSAF